MNPGTIIKNPRITEKASMLLENNVYVFDVAAGSNKSEVEKAIFAIYKVRPEKVRIMPVPKKKSMLRGKAEVRGGGRKALVYLKAGDKIEFI